MNFILGFHRLAINGLNNNSNQPLCFEDIILICNGEIFNYKELYKKHNLNANTDSDCEVIIHLYLLYGIDYTLSLLNGEYAFILIDKKENKMFAIRDPFGIRPMYYLKNSVNNSFYFASELKQLQNFNSKDKIEQFIPGTFSVFNYNNELNVWNFVNNNLYYNTNIQEIKENNSENYYKNIALMLEESVKKRTMTTHRPVACLLSGGLDSSLIAALVKKQYIGTLETYSIGLEGSEDLKYAQKVADHIGSKHTNIIVSEDDFFNAIPNVIDDIESYDTTTVRASVGNWLIGKYIKEHSEAKVIFNGDGADELMGGYLYFNKAPNCYEFDRECKRLLKDIYLYDVLRSDKSISSHGLEPRTPFLDVEFVQCYLSIPCELRFHMNLNKCEKFLIRESINKYFQNLLPDEILWRKKEAFSDGVSSKSRSWFEIAQEKIDNLNFKSSIKNIYTHNKPQTTEQLYYRYLFELNYKNTGYIVPYFWMPKYIESHDASARTLSIYN